MDNEFDLNLILQRELELIELSDNDDDIIDSLLNYEDTQIINIDNNTSTDESNPGDELRAIIESSIQLTHLNANEEHSVNISDNNNEDMVNNSNEDEEMIPLPSSSQSSFVAADNIVNLIDTEDKDPSHGNPYDSTLLSEEERSIIEELLAMMLDAVEQCAPICEVPEDSNSNLPVVDEDDTLLYQKLVIINNDEDVKVKSAYENENSENIIENERVMADVLIKLMQKENEKSKSEQIAAVQARETIEWEESNAFKETLERDRQQRLERKARREREKIAAAKENAATNAQRVIRGYFGRKRAKLFHADREAQLRREAAERAAAEEKRRLELELKNQAIELLAMSSAEQESKTIWKAQAKHENLLQEKECKIFADEDVMSHQLREVSLAEAHEKVEVMELAKRKAELLAEPDEEYEFELEDDCSESSDREEVTDELNFQYTDHKKINEKCNSFVPNQPLEPRSIQSLSPRFVKNQTGLNTRTSGSINCWGGAINISNQHDNNVSSKASNKDSTTNKETIPLLSSKDPWIDYQIPPIKPISQEQYDALKESWKSLAVDCLKINDSEVSYNMDKTNIEVANSMLNCLVDDPISCLSPANTIDSPIISSLKHWIANYEDTTIAADQGFNLIAANNKQLPICKLQRHITPALLENDNNEDDTQESTAALNNSINYTGPVDLASDPKGVRELDLCVEDIPDVLFLQRYKWIEKLLLNVNKLTNLAGIEKLKRLKILQVKDNNIVDIATIRNLKGLQYLHLDCNRISDVSALDNLNDLRTVSLCTNNITEVPQIQCQQLQRLEIYRNRIGSLSDSSLKGFPSLIHLDLGYNKLTAVSGNALSSCSLLQTVILSQNLLEQPPYPLRLPMLKSLWLNGNQISSVDSWQPSHDNPWPLFIPMLQKLYLRDNQVSFLPDSVMEQLPMLQELDMSFNALPSRTSLQSIHNCPLLSAIHIQDNPLTTVRNEASGTSTSVPLSEDEQASLHRWLADMCHALQTVSGNSIQNDQEVVQRIRSKPLWKFVLYKNYSDNLSSLNSELWSIEDRQLLHLLKTSILAQTSASSREKIVKRDEIKNSKQNLDKTANAVSIDWEIDYKNILLNQIKEMIRFGRQLDHSIAPSDFNGATFISYNKKTENKVVNDVSSPIEVVTLDVQNVELEVVPEFCFDEELGIANSFETNDNVSSAAIEIQRTFRGSRVRRRLGSVLQSLASIHYEDKELDDMLNMDGEMGSLFDIDEMTELLEFADMDYDSLKVSERNMSQLSSSSNTTIDGCAMVYGDHIRRRRTSENSITTTDSKPPADAKNGSGWFAPPNNDSLIHEQNISSRPSTGMSSVSARTISQGDSGFSTPAIPLYGNDSKTATSMEFSDDLPTARSQASTASRTSKAESKRIEAAELAKEWGINDPKVLAAMMKRNKRMKHFMHADEARAQSKDPIARLDRFLRNAHRGGANASTTGTSATRGNTNTSGSFGGKPKTLRQTGKKRAMAVPAWMIGDNDSET